MNFLDVIIYAAISFVARFLNTVSGLRLPCQPGLAIIMIVILFTIVFDRNKKDPQGDKLLSTNRKVIGIIVFFALGIYSGFIQAGVGFLVMATTAIQSNFRYYAYQAQPFLSLIVGS